MDDLSDEALMGDHRKPLHHPVSGAAIERDDLSPAVRAPPDDFRCDDIDWDLLAKIQQALQALMLQIGFEVAMIFLTQPFDFFAQASVLLLSMHQIEIAVPHALEVSRRPCQRLLEGLGHGQYDTLEDYDWDTIFDLPGQQRQRHHGQDDKAG